MVRRFPQERTAQIFAPAYIKEVRRSFDRRTLSFYFPLQHRKALCALRFEPAKKQRCHRERHRRRNGEIRSRAELPPLPEVEPREHDGVEPAAEQRDRHGQTLLDGHELARPRQVCPRDAERQPQAREKRDVRECLGKNERQCRRHRQDKRHAGKRHECWKGRERKLYLELCAKHLPGLDGQRLREPEGLSLERDRRRRHVVHRRNGAHAGAEQHLRAAALRGEGLVQQRHDRSALPQKQDARDRQQQDTEAAVEHVVRARGEARELLAEKCPIDAPALDGLFAVHSLARCARRSRDLQKAAREQRPRQRKQREDDRRAQQHRCHIARTGQAKDVERVRRTLDLLTVDRGVGDELLDGRLRLEDEEIVDGKPRERDDDRDEALVLELTAHLRHDPAQRAREREHED